MDFNLEQPVLTKALKRSRPSCSVLTDELVKRVPSSSKLTATVCHHKPVGTRWIISEFLNDTALSINCSSNEALNAASTTTALPSLLGKSASCTSNTTASISSRSSKHSFPNHSSGAELTPLQMRYNRCYTHRKEHHDERKKLERDRYWRFIREAGALRDYDGNKRLRVQEPTAWVTRYGERRFISERGRGHFPNPHIIYVKNSKTYGPDPLIGPHNIKSRSAWARAKEIASSWGYDALVAGAALFGGLAWGAAKALPL